MSTISDRLAWARKTAGLSAAGLDRRAGLPVGHCALIEARRGRALHTSTVSKLARALNVSLDWLIDGEGKVPSERALRTIGRALPEAD